MDIAMNKLSGLRQILLGVLLPLALYAQTPAYPVPEFGAPPDVSQALRDRVNQFFQFHIGTINRRAIDLVAEDTKDYYFSSGKVQFGSAKITAIEFSRDLQSAAVRLDATQTVQVQEFSTVATAPMVTTWKIEDGKWAFFVDRPAMNRTVTPMGESAQPGAALTPVPLTNADGTLNIPKDFAEPARVAAQGQAILSQLGPDKESVSLDMTKASEDQVVFHNGLNGSISLQLSGDPRIPGLKIVLDKKDLNGGEDAHVRFTYDPATGNPVAGNLEYVVRVSLIPFNQQYPITVNLRGAAGR
jgi:hypothetical protein